MTFLPLVFGVLLLADGVPLRFSFAANFACYLRFPATAQAEAAEVQALTGLIEELMTAQLVEDLSDLVTKEAVVVADSYYVEECHSSGTRYCRCHSPRPAISWEDTLVQSALVVVMTAVVVLMMRCDDLQNHGEF